MQWVSDKDSSRGPEVFSATAPWGRRTEALSEMWKFFVTTVLPANAEVGWNCFRVEIWADTGRILLFPRDARSRERVERAGLCLVMRELRNKYEELERLDESSFEAELAAELRALADEILAAARAARKVPGLPQGQVSVEVWEADEDAPSSVGRV